MREDDVWARARPLAPPCRPATFRAHPPSASFALQSPLPSLQCECLPAQAAHRTEHPDLAFPAVSLNPLLITTVCISRFSTSTSGLFYEDRSHSPGRCFLQNKVPGQGRGGLISEQLQLTSHQVPGSQEKRKGVTRNTEEMGRFELDHVEGGVCPGNPQGPAPWAETEPSMAWGFRSLCHVLFL